MPESPVTSILTLPCIAFSVQLNFEKKIQNFFCYFALKNFTKMAKSRVLLTLQESFFPQKSHPYLGTPLTCRIKVRKSTSLKAENMFH